MFDYVPQRREAAIVIEATFLMRPETFQRRGSVGPVRGAAGLKVINSDFSYTSVFMKPQNWDTFAGTGFFVMRDPAGGFPNRIGGVIKLEQGLWIAFLGGRFADYPPREMHEFAAWARSLHNPIMADLIATAEPVSAPSSFRFPRSIRRLFGRMQAFPDGLLPFGDAILHFNPSTDKACRLLAGKRSVCTAF